MRSSVENLQIVEVDEKEWLEQGHIHPVGDQSGKLIHLPSTISLKLAGGVAWP